MYLARTRFASDIVAEFLPPKHESHKVIIFCDGMPSMPQKRTLLEFFSKRGFWVVHPRYRGAWESDGVFLKDEPTRDILDIVDQLETGFENINTKELILIEQPEVYIIGTSFGGPAALFASRDERVKKVITVSSVVDWGARSPEEPLDEFRAFVEDAFGGAYRVVEDGWEKLQSGTWYNPMSHVESFDGNKILMLHAEDDMVVLADPVKQFAEKTKSSLVMLKKGGHVSSQILISWRLRRKVRNFLRS